MALAHQLLAQPAQQMSLAAARVAEDQLAEGLQVIEVSRRESNPVSKNRSVQDTMYIEGNPSASPPEEIHARR